MSDGTPDEIGPVDAHASDQDDSIGSLFGRLVDDAEAFVRAEIKLYRVEALARLASYRIYIAFAGIAALLALGSVILLLIALVFAIAPYTGVALAALIVSALSMLLAVVISGLIWRGILRNIDRESQEQAQLPEEQAQA